MSEAEDNFDRLIEQSLADQSELDATDRAIDTLHLRLHAAADKHSIYAASADATELLRRLAEIGVRISEVEGAEERQIAERQSMARLQILGVPADYLWLFCHVTGATPLEANDPAIAQARAEIKREQQFDASILGQAYDLSDEIGFEPGDAEIHLFEQLGSLLRQLAQIGDGPDDPNHARARENLFDILMQGVRATNMNPHMETLLRRLLSLY